MRFAKKKLAKSENYIGDIELQCQKYHQTFATFFIFFPRKYDLRSQKTN